MDFGTGVLAAISRSEQASAELSNDNKTILYEDLDTHEFHIKSSTINHKLVLSASAAEMLSQLNEFDVVEFFSDENFRIVYNDGPDGATLVVTNRCNSNCIMCPCSEHSRKANDSEAVEHLCKMVEYMPSDVRFLTITGGEPTLIKDGMFPLLQTIGTHFEDFTQFLMLTNGRSFSSQPYLDRFMSVLPRLFSFGIPIYGFSPETHDPITQTPGSFLQTYRGLKGLLQYGCDIELRIVVSKLNMHFMDGTAQFIASELQGIRRVNIMATEMCGAAARNRESVWADYADTFQASKNAIRILMRAGIDVALYNFPLCKVDRGFWALCRKSISSYKIRYYDSCQDCSVRDLCGGVFRSTLLLTKMNLSPLKAGEEFHNV